MNVISSLIMEMEAISANNMGTKDKVFLPIKDTDASRKELESMGVKFGDRKDDVLLSATLPSGWKIVSGGKDARCKNILDEKGKHIANIFLKNSGYDYYGHVFIIHPDN